jgi:tRNA(Arg) A34 adenosine deaminase TadA
MVGREIMHPNKTFMRLAIAAAREGHEKGQYPIGAVVVLDGRVIAKEYTTLDKTRNPLNHAEVNAINAAAEFMKKRNPKATWETILKGAWLYSTFESCSMCTSLAVWANMSGIVYGNSMQEFFKAYGMKIGESHYITLHTKEVTEKGTPKLKVYGGFLKDECSELLRLK